MEELAVMRCVTEFEVQLMAAIKSGNIRTVSYILERSKVDINVCYPTSHKIPELYTTFLQKAAAANSPEITELLIKYGANLKQADNLGRSALHWAARRLKLGCMEVLLEYGADINVLNANGDTPITSMLYWWSWLKTDVNLYQAACRCSPNQNIYAINMASCKRCINNNAWQQQSFRTLSQASSLLLASGANLFIKNNDRYNTFDICNKFYRDANILPKLPDNIILMDGPFE
jgi:hypothetical protein